MFLILRKADSDEKVLEEWKQVRHRDPDWVEEETLKDNVIMREEMDDDPAEFIYQEMPHLAEFRLAYIFLFTFYSLQAFSIPWTFFNKKYVPILYRLFFYFGW